MTRRNTRLALASTVLCAALMTGCAGYKATVTNTTTDQTVYADLWDGTNERIARKAIAPGETATVSGNGQNVVLKLDAVPDAAAAKSMSMTEKKKTITVKSSGDQVVFEDTGY